MEKVVMIKEEKWYKKMLCYVDLLMGGTDDGTAIPRVKKITLILDAEKKIADVNVETTAKEVGDHHFIFEGKTVDGELDSMKCDTK